MAKDVECSYCEGTGYDIDGGQCPRCGGIGECTVEDDD